METDFDAIRDRAVVGAFHPYMWWFEHPNQMSSGEFAKACRIGAMKWERLGPRGGFWYAIASLEQWEKLKAWRAALALGVRGVPDAALRKPVV